MKLINLFMKSSIVRTDVDVSYSDSKNNDLIKISNYVSDNIKLIALLDKDVYRGASYDIDINLSNNDIVRAIQYDIKIPEGFNLDIETIVETSVLDDFTTSVSSLSAFEDWYAIKSPLVSR